MSDCLLMRGNSSRRALVAAAGIATITIAGAALASGTLPPRKPGLWVTTKVIHITAKGSPADEDNKPIVDAMCMDAATDAIEAQILAGKVIPGSCASVIQGSGRSFAISNTCPDPMGGGNVVSRTTIVWKSDTEVHAESQSNSPHYTASSVEDSKWVGACPSGVASGDQGTYLNGVFKKIGNIKDLLPSKEDTKSRP